MERDACRRGFVVSQVGLCEMEENNCALGALATLHCIEGTSFTVIIGNITGILVRHPELKGNYFCKAFLMGTFKCGNTYRGKRCWCDFLTLEENLTSHINLLWCGGV